MMIQPPDPWSQPDWLTADEIASAKRWKQERAVSLAIEVTCGAIVALAVVKVLLWG